VSSRLGKQGKERESMLEGGFQRQTKLFSNVRPLVGSEGKRRDFLSMLKKVHVRMDHFSYHHNPGVGEDVGRVCVISSLVLFSCASLGAIILYCSPLPSQK
jgi:hypothetical protein